MGLIQSFWRSRLFRDLLRYLAVGLVALPFALLYGMLSLDSVEWLSNVDRILYTFPAATPMLRWGSEHDLLVGLLMVALALGAAWYVWKGLGEAWARSFGPRSRAIVSQGDSVTLLESDDSQVSSELTRYIAGSDWDEREDETSDPTFPDRFSVQSSSTAVNADTFALSG